MEELTLLVKGSSADPYELTFIKDGASLTALCNCPAGIFGSLCKHRVAVLDGDDAAVVDDHANKLSQVVAWLTGTDVEAALVALRDVEASNTAPKSHLTAAKKTLSKAMNS